MRTHLKKYTHGAVSKKDTRQTLHQNGKTHFTE